MLYNVYKIEHPEVNSGIWFPSLTLENYTSARL